MFQNSEVTGLLTEGTFFEGHLRFNGVLKMGGEFKGCLESQGTLVVQEGSKVEGKILVDTVIVSGSMSNVEIFSKKKVLLQPTAVVKGFIETTVLEIKDGALFEGSIKKIKATS